MLLSFAGSGNMLQSDWVTTTTILADLRSDESGTAWKRLVDRFRRPIIAFAIHIGLSPSEADDVAQETLLAFLENYRAGKYEREKGRLSSWLFGIAYRQTAGANRTMARNAGRMASDQSSILRSTPDESTALADWDAEWAQSILASCLAQVEREVDHATFRAFELTVRDGLSAEEAAAALASNVKLVYNAKHRVLKRIRDIREGLEQP